MINLFVIVQCLHIVEVYIAENKMISTCNTQKQPETENSRSNNLLKSNYVYSNPPLQISPHPTQPAEEKNKNQKNKFINKLKQLQANSQMKTLHKSHPSQSGEWLLGTDRKERNKLAARQSRNRKKLYVKLLETKIQNLEMQMIETVDEIQQLRLEIFNAQMHRGVQSKEAKHKQLHIIKKMEGLLANQDFEERNNQISICLDSIIYRIGALGNQRKAALKKIYTQFFNFFQPALYRYMFWSAIRKKHIFGQPSEQAEDKWWKEIEQVAIEVLNTPGLKEKVEQTGKQISSHCADYLKSALDLQRFRAQIEKKGQDLQNCFNQIRELLLPEQVAQLILFAERYQFKREIRLFEQKQQKQQENFTPSKKVKVEENSV